MKKDFAITRNVQEFMRGNGHNPMQRGGEMAVTYAQRFAEIAGAMQADVAQALNQGAARTQEAVREAVASQARNLPQGGNGAGSMFEGAMQFAAQAMEAMQASQAEATRMFSESVQRLTEGAAQAAMPQPSSRKRATTGANTGRA